MTIFFWRIKGFALALGLCASYLSNCWAETLVVKHYDQGYTPSIRAFQRDLLQLMLRRTEPAYGEFRLDYFSMPLSTNRAKIVLQQGVDVNVLFASEWQGWGVDPDQVIALELPIYKGLHGLRNLIIRRDAAPEFAQINELANFLALSAGQGANWLDVGILRANHVQTEEAQSFVNLMPMLQKKRFDYLPLSVLEADAVMLARPAGLENLQIVPDLLLFYPLPSYLYVPKNQPKLAERLLAGFDLVAKSGELDALFDAHFSGVARSVSGEKKRLVIMTNPDLSDGKNREMIGDLIARYGDAFILIK